MRQVPCIIVHQWPQSKINFFLDTNMFADENEIKILGDSFIKNI